MAACGAGRRNILRQKKHGAQGEAGSRGYLPVAVYDADGGKVAKGICPGEKADPALRSG